MTDREPTSEHIELPEELTEQDKADLRDLYGEQEEATYHSILQVWAEIMKPENIEANKGITMQWSTMICGMYPLMDYGHMQAFHDKYFALLEDAAQRVRDKIADNEDCLSVYNAEEDVAANGTLYKELLFEWQLDLQAVELEWSSSDPDAPATVAALGEVQKFLFGERGLTGHLEVIKLEFTDVDQTELREALDEQRKEWK
jgi:hypothetical protein